MAKSDDASSAVDDTPAVPDPTPDVAPEAPETNVSPVDGTEPIKVRLSISPDVETELLGGETELLDLKRQGLIHNEEASS